MWPSQNIWTLCTLLPGIFAILGFVQTKETNNFIFKHILNFHDTLFCKVLNASRSGVSAVAYSKWPFDYLSFTLLPHFYFILFAKINKIDQQFHDTLYFCKVLNAISEVEFLLLHIVGMQKSKYTTGWILNHPR